MVGQQARHQSPGGAELSTVMPQEEAAPLLGWLISEGGLSNGEFRILAFGRAVFSNN